jgi:quaternary ammonium compound-resistance protein SugE
MNQYIHWIWLILAGFFEVAWVIGIKYSDGFSQLIPSLITIVAMIGSSIFLSLAVKTIPIGTAYPIWVGIGAVGAAIVGMILFNESAAFLRLFCIFLILAGITGLSLLKTTA